jgi:putative tricarboxylic transport membrane protein
MPAHTSHPRLVGELGFAVVLLLLSIVALWQSWRISGFASWSSPGALPMLAALVMVVCGLLILRDTLHAPAAETTSDESLPRRFARRITPAAIVWFTLLIVLYIATLEPLGFMLSSFVFLVLAMHALGSRRIVRNIVISAVALALIYAIFQTAFSVVLPEGVLGRLR